MLKTILCLILASLSFAAGSQELNIIPLPVSSKRLPGEFGLTRKTVIVAADVKDKSAAAFLRDYIDHVYGLRMALVSKPTTDCIRLRTTTKKVPKNGYELLVTREGITINGDSYAGTFWGMQTLIQLLEPYDFGSLFGKGNGISVSRLLVPAVAIADFPRFAYRGMHLDAGRHFLPVSFIKKYIDYIALHKMNYFHWHLADDQGWRMQIKAYPLLTSVGSFRNGTVVGHVQATSNDDQRHGSYTHEEIREVIRYATDRHITVVPGLEMPGHASAAIGAYPWLSCFPNAPPPMKRPVSLRSDSLLAAGRVKLIPETRGVSDDLLCAGKDSSLVFLERVLDEVIAIFPSKYIHIGGDEAPKGHWKKCGNCRARAEKEGLKNEQQLQGWLVARIQRYLRARGRTAVSWEQKRDDMSDPNSVVMSRTEEGSSKAVQKGQTVIMAPPSLTFDQGQFKDDSLIVAGYVPIEKVYAYEPVPRDSSPGTSRLVIGAQATVWTQTMKTPGKVEDMILPRMSALSEVLWSPIASRSWTDFQRRLKNQARRIILWKGSLKN